MISISLGRRPPTPAGTLRRDGDGSRGRRLIARGARPRLAIAAPAAMSNARAGLAPP
jgi:hypothetical protein